MEENKNLLSQVLDLEGLIEYQQGSIVSRTIIKIAREQYQNVKVIFIKVPIEITVKRIKSRGRENKNLLGERIERARTHQTFSGADFMIDNSGDLKDAVNHFLNYLLEIINE